MNKRQKAIINKLPKYSMTSAEWEFATDDYKEHRKDRKMNDSKFKEYRDIISEGKFSKKLIDQAVKIAKKSSGEMTKAFKAIEKIKKGLGDDPAVLDALRFANESKKEDDEENALLDKESVAEAILRDRDFTYDEKEGVVKISKKNFKKVKKDSKGTDKSKPTMMVLTKKGTALVPVKFTEGYAHILDENLRKLATKGMGTETKKMIKVGTEIDYYDSKIGDKHSGTITKISSSGYELKDDKTGKKEKFAFYDKNKAKKLMDEQLKKIKGRTPGDEGRRGAVEDDIEAAEKKGDKKLVKKLKEAMSMRSIGLKGASKRSRNSFSPQDIKKAIAIAKKSSGAMTKAYKAIEKLAKGLGDNIDVANALRVANESNEDRDYRREYDNYQGKPEQIARRSSRNKARRVMGDDCEEGKDVGHKDNNPMNNKKTNLRNEDPSVNRREPRLRKEAQTQDNEKSLQEAHKMLKKYKENEDENRHSENYLLLAKQFGTPKEVKAVEAILKRNAKQGHTSTKDNSWMYKNINPYYKKLVKESMGNIVDFQSYISEASGNDIKKYMKEKWKVAVKSSKVGSKHMKAVGKIPNEFRKMVVDKFIPNAKIMNKDDIHYGNIMDNMVTLRSTEWDTLISESIDLEEKKIIAKKGGYEFYHDKKKDLGILTYKGKEISAGDYDDGAGSWFMDMPGDGSTHGQTAFDSGEEIIAWFSKHKIRSQVESIEEAKSKYKIDHKTYSSAVDEALKVADRQGYEVDMDDYFNQIATGPRKPSDGKTNSFKISLTKKGKEQKKKLQIQIYGKGKHGYELNCYIA